MNIHGYTPARPTEGEAEAMKQTDAQTISMTEDERFVAITALRLYAKRVEGNDPEARQIRMVAASLCRRLLENPQR